MRSDTGGILVRHWQAETYRVVLCVAEGGLLLLELLLQPLQGAIRGRPLHLRLLLLVLKRLRRHLVLLLLREVLHLLLRTR